MRMPMLILLILTIPMLHTNGQSDDKRQSFFLQPELMIGKAFKTYTAFPSTSLNTVYSFSFGKLDMSPSKPWARFFNYPSVGLTFNATNYGNSDVFGWSYSLVPFLTINMSKKLKHSLHWKIGLGISYFTTPYDTVDNLRNLAIGSHFTWAFQLALKYNFMITNRSSVSFSGTYLHHSNGHTQLPNFGLNAFYFSGIYRYYLNRLSDDMLQPFNRPRTEKHRDYFITARMGLGMHEFGAADGPVGGTKMAVHSLSVNGGIRLKRVMHLHLGLTYKFYQHYYSYINEKQLEEFIDEPIKSASCIFISAGLEFNLGHMGIEYELGINLTKPFFPTFHELYEWEEGTSYWLKRTIVMRLGLKAYLFNPTKDPANNFFAGLHLSTNMTQADFSEISVGYVRRIGGR